MGAAVFASDEGTLVVQPQSRTHTPSRPFGRLGVRGRLLTAFLAISGFAAVAAAASVTSFSAISDALERITQRTVPLSLASLELSRQAERIVAAAPALLAADDADEQQKAHQSISLEVDRLEGLLRDLRRRQPTAEALDAIEALVDGLAVNLDHLNRAVSSRLQAAEQKQQRLHQLSAASIAISRLLSPGLLILEAKRTEWRNLSHPSSPATGGVNPPARLARTIAYLTPYQEAEFARSSINDGLLRASAAPSLPDLELLGFPLASSLRQLDGLVPQFEPSLQQRIGEQIALLWRLAEGDQSIPAVRQQELELIAEAQRRLHENAALSTALMAAVDDLVDNAKLDIGRANEESSTTQELVTITLLVIVGLSLVTSVLIVWLYVHRNLIRRLTSLSTSMLAVAGGNLRVPIPRAGSDEIADMADALTVFRDTAIEIEEKNLRRADALLHAILPPSAAQELKTTGRVSAKQFDEVAILFADIAGFTTYCRDRSAEEVVDALTVFTTKSEEILANHGLEKIKTVGDGIIATCNLLMRNDDPVMAAVRCATALRAAAREDPGRWHLRVGIHIGTIVAGVVGQTKFTFDIWGDAVNVAARLSEVRTDGICLSRGAWERVAARCTGKSLGEVEIRGRGPIEVYTCRDILVEGPVLRAG